MENKYYLVKMLVNTAGQDAPSINEYPEKEKALIAYHNVLSAYHNADDVLYAVVEIINWYGNIEIMETVDHRPTPNSEAEEE